MTNSELKIIIDYLNIWKKQLEEIAAKPEHEEGKKDLLSQITNAIEKFEEELRIQYGRKTI